MLSSLLLSSLGAQVSANNNNTSGNKSNNINDNLMQHQVPQHNNNSGESVNNNNSSDSECETPKKNLGNLNFNNSGSANQSRFFNHNNGSEGSMTIGNS